jgi:hypothetical protein
MKKRELTKEDLRHLRREYEEQRKGHYWDDEGGYVDVMTSIGYVGLWSDGTVTYHGGAVANILDD